MKIWKFWFALRIPRLLGDPCCRWQCRQKWPHCIAHLPFLLCYYFHCIFLFSRLVVSHSFWPHGLQHARLHCLLLYPKLYLKLMFILSMMPLNYLIICCPLLLLPSIFPSIRVFSNDLALCIRWPKYWSFTFSISPSSEYSELISYRIHWFIPSQSKGLSKVFSSTTIQKSINSSAPSLLYGSMLTSVYDYWEKNIALTI